MKRLKTTSVAAVLAVAAIVLAAGCGGSSNDNSSSSDVSPAFSSSDLAALPNDELDHERRLDLEPALLPARPDQCRERRAPQGPLAHPPGSGIAGKYSGEAQPIVYKNVIYVITGADDVFAIDAKSGATKWSYRANLNQKINTICCGWTNRGVALGDGRVYFGQLDGKVVALDQKNGQIAWTKEWPTSGRARRSRARRCTTTAGSTSACQAASTGSGSPDGSRCQDGQRGLALLHDPRTRARRDTRPGPPTTIPGRPAAHRSGRRPRSIRSWACSTSPRGTRRLTSTERPAPATTCSPRRSSRSTRRRASTAGTSSRSTTTSGTRRPQPDRALRRLGRRQAAPCDRRGRQDRLGLHPRS